MALTKIDLKKIELLIDGKLGSLKTDVHVLKTDVSGLRRENGSLGDRIDGFREEMRKWRDDFYTKIDPILKEVKDSREERAILSHQVSDNSDRIEKLEEQVFSS